ncbi:hypothetical protein [Hydrogenophaga sp.]|uniref:hypothetical protein n=1 Tax=Hydrogenophaga sp. TaxID=1904254 RepID=UPI003F6FA3F0
MASPEATHREVIADFCRRMKLDDAHVDAVAEGAMIEIEGVRLAITFNQVIPESPAVSIYVDVGMPPRVGEAAVLRVLLQMNHAQSANRGLAYCIGVNGHVIGVIHVGLGGLQGQGLEALVNSLVDTALEFRQTCFLWGPATEADAQGHDFSPSL